MKKQNLHLIGREERARDIALEIEDEIKRNNTSVHDAIVRSLTNYRHAKVIFPYNTENEVEKWNLDRVAKEKSIAKSIPTKLLTSLQYIGEDLTRGAPTDEVAMYVYNRVQQDTSSNYVFRNFGKKQYGLLEEYLRYKKLIR